MLGDTIAAVASPPGSAARGVIRISGPQALAAADCVVRPALPHTRGACVRAVAVRGYEVEGLCLIMPAPGSYTGEDTVELHLPGSPLLLECVLSDLERHGARRPTPGEFTRRAFEHGRLRLEQAEAVADLIAADGDVARRFALYALTGGLAASVARTRALLDDARAVLESGLDFTAEETGSVDAQAWLGALVAAEDLLATTCAQLPDALRTGELLLLGAADAGKSSLCNALAQRQAVLVGAGPGTTRDVIAVSLAEGVTLLDAPGDVETPGEIEAAAIALRDQVGARAAGALLVIDLGAPRVPHVPRALPIVAVVCTKRDLVAAPGEAMAAVQAAIELRDARRPPWFAVSNTDGAGIAALRAFLLTAGSEAGIEAGTMRWGDALRTALDAVRQARAGAAHGHEELVAADLAHALGALDAVHGRTSTETVLDRIFARFCMGK